jgi:hypothetical protein
MPNGSPRIRVDSNNFQAWPLRRRRPKMTICSRKKNRVRIFTVRQSQINRKKATRALHRMAFARLFPRPSMDSVSGRNSVRVEVSV